MAAADLASAPGALGATTVRAKQVVEAIAAREAALAARRGDVFADTPVVGIPSPPPAEAWPATPVPVAGAVIAPGRPARGTPAPLVSGTPDPVVAQRLSRLLPAIAASPSTRWCAASGTTCVFDGASGIYVCAPCGAAGLRCCGSLSAGNITGCRGALSCRPAGTTYTCQ
jgi:hypothetical protein